jgi:nitrous oxidase accessory protein NosD
VLAIAAALLLVGDEGAPYRSIQDAIDAARDGDIVEVDAGTWTEDVLIEGKSIELRSREPHRATIRGTGRDAAVTLLWAGDSVVEGFRITGGRGRPGFRWEGDAILWEGGGIYAEGGAPLLRGNLIEGNDIRRPGVLTRGGGIALNDAAARVEGNIVRRNASGRGAGIASAGAPVTIAGNRVEDNIGSDDHGGGVFVSSPYLLLEDNEIRGNEIGRGLHWAWGGGIFIHDSQTFALLRRNHVTANHAERIGSGTFIDNEATAILDHERIERNACPPTLKGGAGLYVDGLDEANASGSWALVLDSVIDEPNCNAVYVEAKSELRLVRTPVALDAIYADDTSRVTHDPKDSRDLRQFTR